MLMNFSKFQFFVADIVNPTKFYLNCKLFNCRFPAGCKCFSKSAGNGFKYLQVRTNEEIEYELTEEFDDKTPRLSETRQKKKTPRRSNRN